MDELSAKKRIGRNSAHRIGRFLWKDEDEELVLAGTKRVVNRAWALAE